MIKGRERPATRLRQLLPGSAAARVTSTRVARPRTTRVAPATGCCGRPVRLCPAACHSCRTLCTIASDGSSVSRTHRSSCSAPSPSASPSALRKRNSRRSSGIPRRRAPLRCGGSHALARRRASRPASAKPWVPVTRLVPWRKTWRLRQPAPAVYRAARSW